MTNQISLTSGYTYFSVKEKNNPTHFLLWRDRVLWKRRRCEWIRSFCCDAFSKLLKEKVFLGTVVLSEWRRSRGVGSFSAAGQSAVWWNDDFSSAYQVCKVSEAEREKEKFSFPTAPSQWRDGRGPVQRGGSDQQGGASGGARCQDHSSSHGGTLVLVHLGGEAVAEERQLLLGLPQ